MSEVVSVEKIDEIVEKLLEKKLENYFRMSRPGFNIESNQPIFRCDGDIIAFSSSDITLKENISPIENALKMINSLSGNVFAWKSGLANKGMDTGIIAQEVEALGLPGITATRQDGTKGVRYDRLIPVLIEAVKELTAKVNALEGS